MNDARRRVERALMVSEAADELAQAVDAVLAPGRPLEADLVKLREALAGYRAARGA